MTTHLRFMVPTEASWDEHFYDRSIAIVNGRVDVAEADEHIVMSLVQDRGFEVVADSGKQPSKRKAKGEGAPPPDE